MANNNGDGERGSRPDLETPEQEETTDLTYDTWLSSQEEGIQQMITGHVAGLRSALDSERTSRKDLEKQLRQMAKKAEGGSETQNQLNQMADNLASTSQQVDFYEAAHTAGARNLKLAYLAAVDGGFIDSKGQADIRRLSAAFPELFAAARPPAGNAGSGTSAPPTSETTMDDFIRRSAGR